MTTLLFAMALRALHAMPVPTVRTHGYAVASHPRICARGAVAFGTDVSDNNSVSSWSRLVSGGLSFVFVKATEGITERNPKFKDAWAQAKARGLRRGAYHYFHPKDNPVTAADAFVTALGGDRGEIPPVLDWEVTDGVSNAVARARALTWLEVVARAAGRTPLIYVSPAFWTKIGGGAEFAGYPLFVAEYDVPCPSVPPPWTSWTFWQSGIGSVPGVKGPADQDLFNGAATALGH